ncbi:MAG TPA: hypothetical protein VK934_02500 [Fimbriimonas sp.]|nr:hypothetical protein [Fimbriimonas sp.]
MFKGIDELKREEALNVLWGLTRVLKQAAYTDKGVDAENLLEKNQSTVSVTELAVIRQILAQIEAARGCRIADLPEEVLSEYIQKASEQARCVAGYASDHANAEARKLLQELEKVPI